MSTTLDRIPPYASKRISQLAQSDKDFVSLSIGEPWFGPPPQIDDIFAELQRSDSRRVQNDFRHYCGGRGDTTLRESVVEYCHRTYGLNLSPERNVLITHGGSQAFMLAILAATEVGDEVIIPDPTYMLYANTCILLQRIPVRPKKMESDGFVLSSEELLNAISSRSRMLVLNSPENPTGVVYTRAELRQLYEVCYQNNVILLHDEVYDRFVFEGEHSSCASFDDTLSHVVQLNSVSKRYGMPGLRIGWLVANEQIIALAAKALEYVGLSVSGLCQYIAEKVLSDTEIEMWLTTIHAQVRSRRDTLQHSLNKLGFRFPPRGGSGGFFLFPNIGKFRDNIGPANGIPLGDTFAQWLATTAKIAVVPGSVYGSQGNDHVRVVTTGRLEHIQLAIDRLRTLV